MVLEKTFKVISVLPKTSVSCDFIQDPSSRDQDGMATSSCVISWATALQGSDSPKCPPGRTVWPGRAQSSRPEGQHPVSFVRDGHGHLGPRTTVTPWPYLSVSERLGPQMAARTVTSGLTTEKCKQSDFMLRTAYTALSV